MKRECGGISWQNILELCKVRTHASEHLLCGSCVWNHVTQLQRKQFLWSWAFGNLWWQLPPASTTMALDCHLSRGSSQQPFDWWDQVHPCPSYEVFPMQKPRGKSDRVILLLRLSDSQTVCTSFRAVFLKLVDMGIPWGVVKTQIALPTSRVCNSADKGWDPGTCTMAPHLSSRRPGTGDFLLLCSEHSSPQIASWHSLLL